jgi:hypothetical protein
MGREERRGGGKGRDEDEKRGRRSEGMKRVPMGEILMLRWM